MKYAFILVAAITLSGCAWESSNYQLYPGDQLPPEQEVVVTSRADKATLAMAESVFGFKPRNTRLVQADNQRGPNSAPSMNSMMDGSFEVRFLPGVHKVTVQPAVDVYGAPANAITFNGVAGHRYYLGEIRTDPGKKFQFVKDRTFRWQPFLIDMTTGRIIYPKNPQKLIHAGKK